MDTRIAMLGIIVEGNEHNQSVARLNTLLNEYGSYIIGRMGIPYRERKVSVISVALDAPAPVISALSGKIGMLNGISIKTIYGKVIE